MNDRDKTSEMDEGQREEYALRRSEAARQVRENLAYKEAWLMVRAALVKELTVIGTTDRDAMVDAVQKLQNLDQVESVINQFYKKGKVALDRREKRKQMEYST